MPSFKAEASSSSACCRFRKRDMDVGGPLKFPRSLTFPNFVKKKTDQVHKKNQKIHRGGKGNEQEQKWPNSTTWGDTRRRQGSITREGKTSTTLAKQQSKSILVLYRHPKLQSCHHPTDSSVGAGPSEFSPSRFTDSILPANVDSSMLDSSIPLS